MFDGKFRKPVDAAVKPLGIALRRTKVTPDVLTVIGMLVGAAAAVAIGAGHLHLGLILVIAAGLPDLLDGAVAKATNTSSQRGAFFDSTIDRVTDGLLLGGIAYYFASDPDGDPRLAVLPYAVFMMGSIISYQRAKAESLGLEAKGGLMERAERIVMTALALLLDPWIPGTLEVILWIMLVLISITAVQRFVKIWKQAAVAPVTQAKIDLRRQRRETRRGARVHRRSSRVPLRRRVPRRKD